MLVLYQVIGTMSGVQVALNVPIGVQEIVLAAWLISKGFNNAALPGPRPAQQGALLTGARS